jgi:ferritin-like protein
VDVLRDNLAEFLRPDVIMQNLANLSGCALLPPAPPQPQQPKQITAEVVEAESKIDC